MFDPDTVITGLGQHAAAASVTAFDAAIKSLEHSIECCGFLITSDRQDTDMKDFAKRSRAEMRISLSQLKAVRAACHQQAFKAYQEGKP